MPLPSPETEAPIVSPGDAAPEHIKKVQAELATPTESALPLPSFQIVIEPSRGWQLVNVRELWQYRELLGIFAWRDIKVRYKQTILGAAWAILQPAMMMIVFTIFFGQQANISTDVPYPLFVFCGLLPWMFFSTAMTSAANSVVGSERLITKIYFPRLIVPYAAVLAAAVDFCIAFLLLLGLLLYYGVIPGWGILAVPAIFVCFGFAALGVGTLLAAMNVAYRDIRYVIPFMVQIWLFATPAIYRVVDHQGEGWMQTLITINPMNALIETFRAAVLGNTVPWGSLGIAVLMIGVVFVAGSLYFRKVEDSFADII
jgi:lipopolysaccharide transport system permease protein